MKYKWPRRYYIDLFAGAGFAQIRDTGEIVASSAVLAANCTDTFTVIKACEADSGRSTALAKRLEPAQSSTEITVVRGDANEVVSELLVGIPRTGALCVTFADPYGLHLDFETVRAIAVLRSDLIVLLADNMDALRNWARYYNENPNSTLDRFMGESGWRNVLSQSSTDKQAKALRERYIERLRTIGYEHFGFERIANDVGRDIYTLVYASRSAKGLEFWSKASAVDAGGQRSLFA